MAKKNQAWLPASTAISILFFCCLLTVYPAAKKSALQSSTSCKECHVEIYNHWKNAMHSMSLEDPIFQASYIQSYFKTAGKAKYNCLRCHAPATLINEDFDLKEQVTNEGVSCDFCHSIKKVNLENKDHPFELDPGEMKWGPLSDMSSPAHKTAPNPLFKSSELCAGCHEYTNDHGVRILGTYSEWKESPYAQEGIQCQNCHMPLIPGKTVKPAVKESSQKKINLHAISASHSTEELQKALTIEITEINKEKDVVQVVVTVTNKGSGHLVPTGIPARQLILLVELKTPNEYFVQQKMYGRTLLDSSGNEIKKECEVFLNAAKVSFDNRLKPRETRTERFAFVMPKHKKITVSARIDYFYKTTVLSPTEMRVKMAEDVKTISK